MLKLRYQKKLIEAGCDEAGRGCLAGPVFAASVILPSDFEHPDLNDSKQLSENKRDELRFFIEAHALTFAVGICTAAEIDEINILKASFLAMHRAIDQLNTRPQLLLIDGNRFNTYQDIPHHCIIKGDSKFQSIAAASILAKTYRDEYMLKIAADYPAYRWERNKGYPTKAHRDAIGKHGATEHHRATFTLLPQQLKVL
jgi:ribonuclease HII